MNIITAYNTDVGTVKEVNQDGLLIKVANSHLGKITFLCICDGMGGLASGELASSHVIRQMAQWFDNELKNILRDSNFEETLKTQWNNLLNDANTILAQYGRQHGIKLGTTITALLMFEDMYYIIHVGDCRAYIIGDDITQLTQDQTVLAREIRQGKVAAKQGQKDIRESVLLQCVGASKTIEPEFVHGKMVIPATYMVCSDGFRHKVNEAEMLEIFQPNYINNEREAKHQCDYLVNLNKQRMERDNITVAIAHIS